MPTLKSKNRSESDFIRYVNLYKDDISNIIEIMKDGSSYVSISDNKYKYESEKDFNDNHLINASQIEIEAHGPKDSNFTVSCECKNDYIYLHILLSTPTSRDIYRNLKEYIKSKSSLWLKISRSWIKTLILVISIISIMICSSIIIKCLKYSYYKISLTFILIDLISIFSFVYSMKESPSCKIDLNHNRGEVFVFGKSKQDFMYDTLKMLIAALLGSIITLFVKK